MKKQALIFVYFVAILAAAGSLLSAPALQVPSGTWIAGGLMNSARTGASSVLLNDGRILITGGNDANGASNTAEFFGANGSFSPATTMNVPRSGHVSVVLQDGRVLVAGGATSGGGVTNSAEIYDPAADLWTNVSGGMLEARSGQTVTLLNDGRVLLAGGSGSSGTISLTAEIFDPVAQMFTLAGQLSSARKSHAAAMLSDGRVLIVGGTDATNVLATSDIYDPVTGTIFAGPALSTPRQALSATTLLDGRVLVAGGNNIPNGSTTPVDLSSAEILDAGATVFSPAASAMLIARGGQQAFLLPHNNSVLIVGGTSNGTAIAAAELYVPWGGNSQTGIFQATGSMTNARASATGSALQQGGVLLVAGGKNASGAPLSSSELYGFATVKTDARDYPPGSTVNITGSGWQPGETVALTLVESPLIDTHGPFTAIADANGNISDRSFVTDMHDLNIKFSLTAVGSVSQAQTAFTDAITLDSVTVGSQTGVLISGIAGSASYAICVDYHGNNSTISFSVISGLPSGVSSSFSANNILNPAIKCPATTTTLTLTTTAAAAGGSYTFTVQATGGGTVTSTGTLTLNNNKAGQTISVTTHAPASAAYNSNFLVAATASSGLTVAITSTGGCSGSGSSSATITMTSSTTACVVHYNQAGNSNFNAAPEVTESTTATKDTPTITWSNPADITYGTPLGATQLNATASVPGSFVYTPASGSVLNVGSGQTLHGAFTPTDATNYNSTSKDVTINVNAKTLTASIIGNPTKPYDGNSSATLTSSNFSLTGLVGTESFTVTKSSGTYNSKDVATASSVTANLAAGDFTPAAGTLASNYVLPTTASGAGHITALNATWTTNASSKTYGDLDPNPLTTGSGTNFIAADGVSATYSRAAGETVLGGPYHITATLAPAAALSNYNITNAGASFTINVRNATWTTNPSSKTYGDLDPNPLTTGSGTNFIAADGVSATYSRAAGETVLGGPYHITATLAPAAALSNYNITNAGASFTINVRNATWTTNASSKTYGDLDPNPLTTGSGTNFIAADGVSATYSRAAGETVLGGPYHITATLAPAAALSNYNITNAGASFTINVRNATWTTNASSKTYGDLDPNPLTTGSGTNFIAADGVSATYSRAAGETVLGGPYHITATLAPAAALSNYNITNAGASFTINVRNATWTTNPSSKTYGDLDPNPLTTGSGTNFIAADGVSATYSRAAGETVLGGPYHITATLAPAAALSNYNITNAGASFTINVRNATWTTNPSSKTYGDLDPNPLTTGSGTNFIAADGVSATYSRAAGETVLGGPYHITATLAPAAALSNYNITNAGADFTINVRNATWTTNPSSKTYGDLDPNPLTTGSGTNFIAADGVSATYSRAAGETVLGGPYHITATLAPAAALSNYNITNAGASFTINVRNATWTTNASSKTYGDLDPNPLTTGSGTNFIAADGVSATYSRAAGETVLGGPYHITATLAPAAALSNYNITNAGASFTINVRNATWTTNASSKTYGDLDPNPLTTGSGTNFIAADGVSATYSRAAGETVLGGPYHITATLAPAAALSNYNITNAGADFTINVRNATWTTNPSSKTYGDLDPNPLTTGSGTNFIAADGVSATYSRAAGETVLGGPYHITATLAPAAALSNYNITNAGASFTITRANTTTSVTSSTTNPSVYDQPITIYASVSNASTSAAVSEGMVMFTADPAMTPLCTTTTVISGGASCTTGSLNLAVGGHTIIATYMPGPDFVGSGSASVAQTVNARHTSVAITSTEIPNFATGSVAINTTVHIQVTVTDDDPAGTPITPTGTFPITDLIASDVFSPASGGNGSCVLSGIGASASCSLTVTPVEADLHELTAGYPGGDAAHLSSTQNADMTVTAPLVSQKTCLSAPFNGTAIPAGSTVWFNAVFQTTGQKINALTHLSFYNQTIQIGSNGTPMHVPDGVIRFDPNATFASTNFDAANDRWNTTLPTYNLAAKDWLSGMPVQVPSGLAAGTAPVTWCGQFASDDANLQLGWQWAAAAYSANSGFTYFDPNNPSDLNYIGVKAVDDNKADINYKNSDHAGTPENFLKFVIGGARGGGGGNYTGGYSGSGKLN